MDFLRLLELLVQEKYFILLSIFWHVADAFQSHTILGSKTQRGLTQLSLDLLFRSLSHNILDPSTTYSLHTSLCAAETSEAQVLTANAFFDMLYGEPPSSRSHSRAATPLRVQTPLFNVPGAFPSSPVGSPGPRPRSRAADPYQDKNSRFPTMRLSSIISSPKSIRIIREPSPEPVAPVPTFPSKGAMPSYMQSTRTFMAHRSPTKAKPGLFKTNSTAQDNSLPPTGRKLPLPRVKEMPTQPDISDLTVDSDPASEYAVVISMYEVYNDRIFDLLTPSTKAGSKEVRRRALLFKPTEQSPDRKVVAGLRKIICASMKEALLVLDAGLTERRVAGTGSNSVSSRSHGFFCVEVKKRRRALDGYQAGSWHSSALTIVDLAGSERARDAKTQGATLAEAGKINESLMYLGQCLQMQSDIAANGHHTAKVPYRQCKLTELLFSNSFPKDGTARPQRGTMIVTADPVGDYNATSQILRYSALAREITVPRVPSITASIRSGATSPFAQRSNYSASVSSIPGYFGATSFSTNHSHHQSSASSDDVREPMEAAAQQIAQLETEVAILTQELATERQLRQEAEAHAATLAERQEQRADEIEQNVREEMFAEMEARLDQEMRRWKLKWEEEREKGDDHLDRKLELMAKQLSPVKAAPKFVEEKENINDEEEAREARHAARALRHAQREAERSPTKERCQRIPSRTLVSSPKKETAPREALSEARGFVLAPLKHRMNPAGSFDRSQAAKLRGGNASPLMAGFEDRDLMKSADTTLVSGRSMSGRSGRSDRTEETIEEKQVKRSPSSSPMKKVRKLGARKWEMGEEVLL